MRKCIFVLVVVFGLQSLIVPVVFCADKNDADLYVTISGAWALYPMAVKWAEEFGKIHPDARIEVTAGGAGKGMADALAGMVDIGMVSRAIYKEETDKGAWGAAVAKDAVIPTISSQNPFLKEILKKGIKKESFIGIWVRGDVKYWEDVLGGLQANMINAYTRSDACGAAETWAKYLGKKQEDLKGTGVYGDPGIAEAVKNDSLGIGFNNVNFAYDPNTKAQVSGIRVLPIDLNDNGQIDPDEDFYATRDDILAAIEQDRYPSPPARDLYFVCNGKPTRAAVVDFLKWVLTDGQRYVPESGYIKLTQDKLDAQVKALEAK